MSGYTEYTKQNTNISEYTEYSKQKTNMSGGMKQQDKVHKYTNTNAQIKRTRAVGVIVRVDTPLKSFHVIRCLGE